MKQQSKAQRMLLKKRIKNELNVLKISTQEQMETEENIVKRKKPLSYSKTITKRDLNDQLYKQTPSNTQNTANQSKSKPNRQSLDVLPTMQTMLQIPKAERGRKVAELFNKVRPFMSAYMQKKHGSRVLQLMFKWGANNVKISLYQCVLQNWKELIKSKYSLYTISKVCKDYDLPGVVEDATLLQGSFEGAHIVQNYITKNPESQGSKKIKEKIAALHTKGLQGGIKSQELLHNLSIKCIEKQYHRYILSKMILRLSISSMFVEEKEKLMEYLVNNVADIVDDEEGVRLFIELINCCNPKQKKRLVKLYMGNLKEIIDNNNLSYVTIMKLLTEVDDTVLIANSLLKELLELLPTINSCKKVFSLFFSLFSPRTNNFNILGKHEHNVEHTECKKPQELRKKELREYLYRPLLMFLQQTEELQALLRHHVNSKLIVAIYKSMAGDKWPGYKQFVCWIAKYYLDRTNDALKVDNFDGCITADESGNKVIKNIFLLCENFIDFFCDEFAKLIVKNMGKFLNSKASFVLLSLIEKGGRDYLLQEVRSNGKLGSAVAGQHYLNLLNGR